MGLIANREQYVPIACCTLPIIVIIVNVYRTEAVNQGGMAICQHNALDCLVTILIGGWNHRDSGEFLLICACIRQNARGTNRLLSILSVCYTPARFAASNFNQRRAALSLCPRTTTF